MRKNSYHAVMGHADREGYYRILGVAPTASSGAIKMAFRQRSKRLHPDHNQRVGAAEQFAALNEAYRVLSDPERRARYDTSDLATEAPGGDAVGRATGSPVPCSRCNRVSAQPRYVIFEKVIGEISHVRQDQVQGIYCPKCARDVAVAASLLCWGLGWLGWPDGPVKALKAIWKNARGGELPANANHRLLAYQATAFAREGRDKLARALAAEALKISPSGPDAVILRGIVAEGDPPRLNNSWGPSPLSTLVQLAPGILLVLILTLLIPTLARTPVTPSEEPSLAAQQEMLLAPATGNSKTPTTSAPPDESDGTRESPGAGQVGQTDGSSASAPQQKLSHIAVHGESLRVGPGNLFSELMRLDRFDTVERLGPSIPGDDHQGWVRIRIGPVVGFVPARDVEVGSGEEGLLAWCESRQGVLPVSGTKLVEHAIGPHTVAATNHTNQDVVVKLRDQDGVVQLSFYLRVDESALINHVPVGRYGVLYAAGDRYSEACGMFLENMSTWQQSQALDLSHFPSGNKGLDQISHLVLDETAVPTVAINSELFLAN